MIFNSFTFDGVNSLDMGLMIGSKDIYSAPERDLEVIEVPGRNGDVIIDNGRYKNIDVKYDVTFTDIGTKATELKRWLTQPGYKKLSDTYIPGFFRYASFNARLELTELIEQAGAASLVFNCKPYMYLEGGDSWEDHTENMADPRTYFPYYSSYNYTGIIVNPVYRFVVNGNGQVSFGLYRTGRIKFDTLEDSQGVDHSYYYVDCENQIAYKEEYKTTDDSGVPIVRLLTCDFYSYPYLSDPTYSTSKKKWYVPLWCPKATGEASITKFEIQPNWRTL